MSPVNSYPVLGGYNRRLRGDGGLTCRRLSPRAAGSGAQLASGTSHIHRLQLSFFYFNCIPVLLGRAFLINLEFSLNYFPKIQGISQLIGKGSPKPASITGLRGVHIQQKAQQSRRQFPGAHDGRCPPAWQKGTDRKRRPRAKTASVTAANRLAPSPPQRTQHIIH